ncbi:MAG: O-methyltransferase [Erysipelotrichaceae bacterium]
MFEINQELISHIKQQALADKVPIIEDEGLEFVISFIKDHDIKSLLEVGTAVGYSSICFASSKTDLRIVTLEIDPQRHQKAKENISLANLNDRIEPILTDARSFSLTGEFDCLFLDGPKAHNQQLLQMYLPNLKPDGYIIVDDVYFHGFIDHPETLQTKRLVPLVKKLGKFRNDMLESKQFQCQYYQIGDGILIGRRRKENE